MLLTSAVEGAGGQMDNKKERTKERNNKQTERVRERQGRTVEKNYNKKATNKSKTHTGST